MIINIHDYKDNSEDTMYKLLKELYPDAKIVSPQIDYNSTAPNKIISDFLMYDLPVHFNLDEPEIQDEHIELIVGTGLGGFIAAALSYHLFVSKHHNPAPTILLEPCLLPWVELPLRGYVDEDGFFEGDYPMSFAKISRAGIYMEWLENACFLLGKDEEDYEDNFCERLFSIRLEGKWHRLGFGKNFENPETLETIKEIIRNFCEETSDL